MSRHVGQGGPPLLGRSRAYRRQALSCQAPIFFRLAARHRHHLVGSPADQRGRSLLVPGGDPVVVAPRRYGPPYDATAAGAAARPAPRPAPSRTVRRAVLTRCHRRLQGARAVPAPVSAGTGRDVISLWRRMCHATGPRTPARVLLVVPGVIGSQRLLEAPAATSALEIGRCNDDMCGCGEPWEIARRIDR